MRRWAAERGWAALQLSGGLERGGWHREGMHAAAKSSTACTNPLLPHCIHCSAGRGAFSKERGRLQLRRGAGGGALCAVCALCVLLLCCLPSSRPDLSRMLLPLPHMLSSTGGGGGASSGARHPGMRSRLSPWPAAAL